MIVDENRNDAVIAALAKRIARKNAGIFLSVQDFPAFLCSSEILLVSWVPDSFDFRSILTENAGPFSGS